MRFAYLDESGIGNAKVEPYVVVAGVIVDADAQIKALEQYLRDMSEEYIHPHLRKFSSFHAKELFSGGKTFSRQTDEEWRRKILRELCEIPKKFNLPVVMGYVPREQYKASPIRNAWNEQRIVAAAQSLASICCVIAVERHMREIGDNEVAALVYENNDHARSLIRDSQRMLKDPDFTMHLSKDALGEPWLSYLPLSRIVEAPLFSEKNESSILQVADAVAWTINRKLRNADGCDMFFEPIEAQLIVRPRMLGTKP